MTLYDNTPQQLDLNIFVDSGWAGCHQTRRITTGFVIELLGTCIHFGSITQAVVALSLAEAEFYAIGTGAQEALYIRNFIMEALNTKRLNVRIHTDHRKRTIGKMYGGHQDHASYAIECSAENIDKHPSSSKDSPCVPSHQLASEGWKVSTDIIMQEVVIG